MRVTFPMIQNGPLCYHGLLFIFVCVIECVPFCNNLDLQLEVVFCLRAETVSSAWTCELAVLLYLPRSSGSYGRIELECTPVWILVYSLPAPLHLSGIYILCHLCYVKRNGMS